MGKWGWFSADEDGKVVAKTEVKDDNTVHRYDYTKPDDIKEGHGHKAYNNMSDYLNDKPSWSRDKNDSSSKDRSWKGNGYDLDLDVLLSLLNDNQRNEIVNNHIFYVK